MWIRNRFLLPSWIRIRIQYAAPDPGEENFAEKSKKSKEIGSICNFMFKKEVNLDKLPVLGFYFLRNLFCLFQFFIRFVLLQTLLSWIRVRFNIKKVAGSALRKLLEPDLQKMNEDPRP